MWQPEGNIMRVTELHRELHHLLLRKFAGAAGQVPAARQLGSVGLEPYLATGTLQDC